jgi:hypothetical protein
MSKYTIDLMYSARKVFQENMVVGVYTESKCFKKKHWHQHTKSNSFCIFHLSCTTSDKIFQHVGSGQYLVEVEVKFKFFLKNILI